MKKKRKRVLIFGIFDGIHEGHHFLFQQARRYGHELLVLVGRDEFVRTFKKKKPKHNEKERLLLVRQDSLVDKAFLGDEKISTYKILEALHPDVICLGYDQDALEKDLKKWFAQKMQTSRIRIVRIGKLLQ